MLVIVEAYKHHSWARLMIAILPWQLAKHFPALWNLVSSQKRKLSSQITLNPASLVSKVCDVFINGDFPSILLGNKGNSNSLYCLGGLLIMVPWQKGFWYRVLGVLLVSLWFLGEERTLFWVLLETKPSLQLFIGALSELEIVVSHIVGFGVGNQTQVLVHAEHLPYLWAIPLAPRALI